MKIFIPILLLAFIFSCQNNKSDKSNPLSNGLSELENEIRQTFSAVDSLLAIDNGKFWQKQLYGPIIMIDPESRLFYANENNHHEDFKKVGPIYTDTMPQDMMVANTAFDWEDKRWSMIMLPLPKDKVSRNNLVIHELFHRIQPSIGFEQIQEISNTHLDTYEGRLLLKLELQALEEALKSKDDTERIKHIENALTFRNRRQTSPDIKNAENSLELNEGLAEYTAIMLSGRKPHELKSHLIESKNEFYLNPTFVRSFAYHTIPIYGYLLSSEKPNWHKEIDIDTNLSDYFVKNFDVVVDNSVPIQEIIEPFEYNYEKIVAEESERERKRLEKIEKLKRKFTQAPILELPFQNMNISFDPRNITPLESLGTVYPNLRVTDNWGMLTVTNDALLAIDWSKVTVSEPDEISNELVKGDGWQLELAEGWKVEKTDGKYKISKE
jgi:hypothetical protein